MVTLIGAATARHILLYRDRDMVDRNYALFWMFAGGLWFTSGLRLVFFQLGFPAIDRALFYVVQVFVVFHIVPASAFTILKLTPSKAAFAAVVGGVSVLSLLFLAFVFIDGVGEIEISKWTSEYRIGSRAAMFFLPAFVIVFAVNGFAGARRAARRVLRRSSDIATDFGTLALLIYMAGGYVDVLGKTWDWQLLLIRAIYLVAALVGFTAYSWDADPERLGDAVERSDW
ncbi:MAG: hypothetical protein KJ042_02100 [Deltaproteobacteria bacterium]|nr:hypothetical protein [Deltaproteobacteria bacterium]